MSDAASDCLFCDQPSDGWVCKIAAVLLVPRYIAKLCSEFICKSIRIFLIQDTNIEEVVNSRMVENVSVQENEVRGFHCGASADATCCQFEDKDSLHLCIHS